MVGEAWSILHILTLFYNYHDNVHLDWWSVLLKKSFESQMSSFSFFLFVHFKYCLASNCWFLSPLLPVT